MNNNTVKVSERILEKVEKGETLSEQEACLFASHMSSLSPEERMNAWSLLQNNTDSLFAIHPHIEQLMIDTAQGKS